MKYYFIFLFALLSLSAFSQSKFRAEIRVDKPVGKKEFRPYSMVATTGYNFTSRLFADIRGEGEVALFEYEGVKDHQVSSLFGIDVGFSFFRNDWVNLDVRAAVSDNFKKKEKWGHTCYDGGVYASWGKGDYKLVFGVGIRHYAARGEYKDYTRFYFSLGVNFGL